MKKFFSHENQEAPPATSTGGKIRLGVKVDLIRCLESDLLEDNEYNHAPITDATILNGAVVVQMLNCKAPRTF